MANQPLKLRVVSGGLKEEPKVVTQEDLDNMRLIPKEKLFLWHSTVMTQCKFPGMKERIGMEQYKFLERMKMELEEIIGVRRDEPDFHGG